MRTVFFLGAGFSSDACLPTMKNFSKESDQDHADIKNQRRSGLKLLLRSAQEFEYFREFCKTNASSLGAIPDNIEDYFCFADIMRRISPPYSGAKGKLSADTLMDYLRIWLWKVYQKCPMADMRQRKNWEHMKAPYRKFWSLLKSRPSVERFSIVTTNYDMIAEYTARMEGVEIAYPFEPKSAVSAFSPTSDQDCTLGDSWIKITASPDDLVVLKLHGSVNYFASADGLLQVADQLIGKTKIGGSVLPPEWPSVFALGFLGWINAIADEEDVPRVVPQIIPPTNSKIHDAPWMKAIWHQAFHEISFANRIVFIVSVPPRPWRSLLR